MAEYENDEKSEELEVDADLQDLVSDAIESAIDFVDNTLSPERAKATEYYLGKKFGNEEPGRSQVVLTEVRDAVDSSVPGLLRLFFGPDHTVEFEPTSAEDVEEAAQKTDYARYVFERDNPGFMIAHATIKDGLLRKIGAVKWGWDESEKKQPGTMRNVSAAQYAELQQDDDVEIVDVRKTGISPEGPLYTIEYARRSDGRVWVEAMAPEELIFTESTTSVDGSGGFIGHRTYKTKQELLDMGIDEEIVEEAKPDDVLRDSLEEIARRAAYGANGETAPTEDDLGEENEEIRYVEGYMRVEGVLRQICTVGAENVIVKNKPVEYVQMAAWCPNPEPHTLAGLSLADSTMDMQLIKSALFRGALDSLSLSLFPRTAYQEGQVSVEDVLNTEIGAPIRTSTTPSNVLQVFQHDWKGADALSAMQYCDTIIEQRTARDKGSMGLDADALQSTTKSGVEAAVTASQERQELVARLYAEMLLKPLFKGIVRELISHQPRKRVIRLRNKYVEMDPRTWNVDMDAVVRVALGSTAKEQKLSVLAEIKATQEGIFQQLGFQNPLVHLSQYYHTIKTGLELAGFRDVENFFTPVDPNWAPPPQQPQPSPEEMLAQIEAQKAQVAAAHKEQELQLRAQELEVNAELKRQELEQKFLLEREKIQAEMELKRLELELEYQTKIKSAELNAQIDLASEGARLEVEQARHNAELEQDREQHSQKMDLEHRKAELQAEAAKAKAKQAGPGKSE